MYRFKIGTYETLGHRLDQSPVVKMTTDRIRTITEKPNIHSAFKVTAILQRRAGITLLCHRSYVLKRECYSIYLL